MICCAHNKIFCAIKILHIVSVSNLIVQYYYKKYRFNPDCSILKKSPEYKLSPGFSCKEGLKKMSLWTRTLSIKIKKSPKHELAPGPAWCRWSGSNRYGIATTGFWVQHVYQFHHTGTFYFFIISHQIKKCKCFFGFLYIFCFFILSFSFFFHKAVGYTLGYNSFFLWQSIHDKYLIFLK